jgi:hypothetical protein
MEIACPSRVARVAVYARGAIVTRVVSVPPSLPKEACDLVVGGVTALSSQGSARARATGGRTVLSLRMRLVVPAEPITPGPLVERLRAVGFERERLETERAQLLAQRKTVAAVSPDAMLQSRWRRIDPAARIEDALAACGIASELGAAIDAKVLDLEEALEQNRREHEAAQLAAAQGRSADRMGAGHPTREVIARLSEDGGPQDASALTSFEVSYVVSAARWWPAYSVRLSDAGRRVAWSLEAFVAQASGEDWTGATLSFCSAGLIRDLRLPELASLRLGRAQPTPRRGYRAAPEGLEELFAAYDAAQRPHTPPSPPPPAARVAPASAASYALDESERGARTENTMALGGAPPPAGARAMPAPAMPLQAPRASLAAPPAAAPARPASEGLAKSEPTRARGGGGAPAREALAQAEDGMLREADTSPGFGNEKAAGIEPADAWLEFDALTMASPGDLARRGHLVLDSDAETRARELGGAQTRASVAVERLSVRLGSDPQDPRGEGFDVRYEGHVPADVPSNARPHRVAIDSGEGPALPRLVAVPRDTATVYRESVATNPFGVALLAGPADLFVDGALITTTALAATGPGGKVVLGLGGESRVRVARNVRAEEGTTGLLGGSTTVDHVVTIDFTSSLGHPVTVELYERLPVTDDKDVAIELRTAQPTPARYDQADRGKPVRGGLKWTIQLPAGGTQRVEYCYRVTLPAKSEIVGGNRRD